MCGGGVRGEKGLGRDERREADRKARLGAPMPTIAIFSFSQVQLVWLLLCTHILVPGSAIFGHHLWGNLLGNLF